MWPSERKRVEAGVCKRARCGEPLATQTLCRRHANAINIERRQKKDAWRRLRRCIDCGTRVYRQRLRCLECLYRQQIEARHARLTKERA